MDKHHELNWHSMDKHHQKCKKLSYNTYVCPCTISAGLYQLDPNKHITQCHQTLSKNPETSCPNHPKKTKWTSATSCMKQLHWLPIRYRSHFKLLTIVYKTLHGMGPTYIRNRLKIKNNIRNMWLSSSTTLYLDVTLNKKRSVSDRGFSYMAAQHWNVLPDHIKRANKNYSNSKNYWKHIFIVAYN